MKKTTRSNIKVKPLEWYIQDDADGLADQGYIQTPANFKLIGRDGYYCHGNNVWFEVDGTGYVAYPGANREMVRKHFCYSFTHNDEAIMTSPRSVCNAGSTENHTG